MQAFLAKFAIFAKLLQPYIDMIRSLIAGGPALKEQFQEILDKEQEFLNQVEPSAEAEEPVVEATPKPKKTRTKKS